MYGNSINAGFGHHHASSELISKAPQDGNTGSGTFMLSSCTAAEGSYSVLLHVVAIFVILIVSLVGTTLPLAGKYVSMLRFHPFVVAIGKCISTGVVISVALVHMVNHGVHGFMMSCVPSSLRDSFDAWPFLFAMLAALLMHVLEVMLDVLLETWTSRDTSESLTESEQTVGMTEPSAPLTTLEVHRGTCHNHGVIALTRLKSARRIASVVFMEFGLALHSVFLGFSVGIARDTEMRALLVAICFHQVFEGLALGLRVAEATMNFRMDLLLVLIYAFSVPLGTAVSVLTVVYAKVSMISSTFITVQAIFDSVCGGMLMYIGFTLLLLDFPAEIRSHAGADTKHAGWRRFAMFTALWSGAAITTVLSKWA